MLAKKYRLQIQDWLEDKNKRISTRKSNFFIARFSSNKLNFSRFGLVISAKVSKSAVKRNRIKRIIFDFIRLNKLNEFPGNDVAITVLFPVAKLTREEIEKETSFILSSA
ncbi:MAG: ribonuclease P protein component [Patescibacteria group bacterium]